MLRLIAALILIGTLLTSGYHRRKAAREAQTISRRSESTALVLGRLLVALPLFGGVVLYLIHPGWMCWAAFDLPTAVRWTGAVAGLSAIPLTHWVLGSLGVSVSPTVLTREDQVLVVTGPYHWVRHPLYTTGILLFLSMGLLAANWFILSCAAVAAVAVRTVVIPREEQSLVELFGQEYETYRGRTGAMLPGVRRAPA